VQGNEGAQQGHAVGAAGDGDNAGPFAYAEAKERPANLVHELAGHLHRNLRGELLQLFHCNGAPGPAPARRERRSLQGPLMLGLVRWLVWLRKAGRFFAHRHTRYVLAWLLAVGTTSTVLESAREHWLEPSRGDGSGGHTSIDFGSAYMMGRMLVLGEGQYLYDRNHLRNVLREAYPRADEGRRAPGKRSDAENFMNWIMGEDSTGAGRTYASCLTPLAAADAPSAVLLLAAGREQAWTEDEMAEAARHRAGGPLYPPINAFVAAWMGPFRPLTAYRLHMVYDLALGLLIALGISVLSSGRIWAPVALTILALYPGFFSNLHLGQTGGLVLAIATWGWVLIDRGRPALGGAVWGVLAFKPSWAMPLFLLLALTRRWKGCAAMLAVGAGLALATLPFVGLHSWFDWLAIAKEATFYYDVDSNWVHLSRDLLSIPRRFLLDFDEPIEKRSRLDAAILGWVLLLSVAGLTVALALWRRRQARATQGPRAGFLLLAAWLCCLHFMYYDTLASFLPVMVLFTNPHPYRWPRFLSRDFLQWERRILPAWRRPRDARPAGAALAVFRWPASLGHGPREVAALRLRPGGAFGWLRNPFPLLALAALLVIEGPMKNWGLNDLTWPLETYCLLALWAWCGVVWARRRRAPAPPGAARREPARPAAGVLAEVEANGPAVTPARAP
jgi:hypothetical protein